jgi:kynureninase
VTPDRDAAAALDHSDPLAGYRDRFVAGPVRSIYLDGNSLGPLPVAAAGAARRTVEQDWGESLVESWEHWIDLPQRVGSRIAPLIGADTSEVTLADSTSVNLYRLAAAAVDAFPGRGTIVTDDGNFPTDRYVLEGLAAERGRTLRVIEADPVEGITAGAVEAALDDDVALASFSAVSYRSAAFADIAAIGAAVRAHGGLVLWDLSHAVGSVPIDLGAAGADLAVGCTYKYLCGGPGAPAFLFVRRALQDALQPPIRGWFAHEDQFGFHPQFRRSAGIGGWLVGTPPVLSTAAAAAGIDLVAEAGIDAIRAKSIAATTFLIDLADRRLAALGVRVATPRDPARRGSHIALQHPEGLALSRWLRAERRVVTDFRAPDTIRVAVSPLFTRFVEVWDAVAAIAEGLESGAHLGRSAGSAVT